MGLCCRMFINHKVRTLAFPKPKVLAGGQDFIRDMSYNENIYVGNTYKKHHCCDGRCSNTYDNINNNNNNDGGDHDENGKYYINNQDC